PRRGWNCIQLPYDYLSGADTDCGLARIATLVDKYREKYEHVILLDNGDFSQGSPLTYYFNFRDTRSPYPLAEIMNEMHFTASIVGNHDIEQGPRVYNRINKQLKFPWLSANANTRNGKSYFQPFTIREVAGLKIAFLGLTTPAIPFWLNPNTYKGIHWQDMKEAASGWSKYLKEDKKVDLLIGMFHAGIRSKAQNDDWPKDIPEENPTLEIAEKEPGFDVIIAGHEHKLFNTHPQDGKRDVNKPAVVLAGSHGCYLGVIRLTYKENAGRLELIDKQAHLESLKGIKPHPRILKLYEPYHKKILKYIDEPVGEAAEDIESNHVRFRDNPVVNLIHQAQLNATTADISLTTVFRDKYLLKKGPIRVRDIYQLYEFENDLYVVLMTGKQMKQHLENSARYFNRIDPRDPFKTSLINNDFKGIEYDMAEGIRYEIDITRPVGERIVNLTASGVKKPLDMKRKYKVAVNSYRAIQLNKKYGCRIIWKSNKELREFIIDYIKKSGKITNHFEPGWRLVPEDITEKIIRKLK
ncbi:MAG: 5'-nucleotidase C-terminal domain-containing protein, partial [Calditrichia bacterium]